MSFLRFVPDVKLHALLSELLLRIADVLPRVSATISWI
uniref:Uncharacterized protein n=1 Tax=Rhizophora mucronata TaxID=61149 RepID=A0A2P2R2M4_RHIMU